MNHEYEEARMGYTHYFSYTPEAPALRSAWLQLRLDTAAILDFVKKTGVQLAGSNGHGAPLIDERRISFNGRATEECEDFTFTLDPHERTRRDPFVWDFTKTNGRPYDMAVTAVLLRAHTLIPDHVAIQSDGSWDADWLEARAIHNMLFGDPGMADPFTDTTVGPAVYQR
ncbi:hypothetical protein ABT354_19920 [Streptomyces sp. NPDC000594]|uniref:hypothetical protein n=1 Tax=Streptomyces sp. NPDC000594 TaxID=3154261 RepID=UPI00331AA33F